MTNPAYPPTDTTGASTTKRLSTEALQAALEAASAGPWSWAPPEAKLERLQAPEGGFVLYSENAYGTAASVHVDNDADRALIEQAREFAAEVLELRARVAELEAEVGIAARERARHTDEMEAFITIFQGALQYAAVEAMRRANVSGEPRAQAWADGAATDAWGNVWATTPEQAQQVAQSAQSRLIEATTQRDEALARVAELEAEIGRIAGPDVNGWLALTADRWQWFDTRAQAEVVASVWAAEYLADYAEDYNREVCLVRVLVHTEVVADPVDGSTRIEFVEGWRGPAAEVARD